MGAANYRALRRAGQTAFPLPALLPEALDISIPSREQGRPISCRLVFPSTRTTEDERSSCSGVVLHIHGGGWVLGDEQSADALLLVYADAADCAVLSVGYRLAPEDPWPRGVEDCVDIAEWLCRFAEKEYGGPLRFLGGEVRTIPFHLLPSPLPSHSSQSASSPTPLFYPKTPKTIFTNPLTHTSSPSQQAPTSLSSSRCTSSNTTPPSLSQHSSCTSESSTWASCPRCAFMRKTSS